MNPAALLDGLLACCALWLAIVPGRAWPALRLGGLVLASAALLGSLRFSGLWPLPALHQFMSLLGAGVGLPLLAVTACWPNSPAARTRRYAWIFGIVAAVLCVLFGVIGESKLWPSVLALGSGLAILGVATARKQLLLMSAGLLISACLALFATRQRWAGMEPGDVLHVGLAAACVLMGVWAWRLCKDPVGN